MGDPQTLSAPLSNFKISIFKLLPNQWPNSHLIGSRCCPQAAQVQIFALFVFEA